ncbi:hypothetical protein FSARC_14471 [Fusarium sarcochroum]|uniref:Uncharacterized protein n=1 Tax=Fusarium sarcochroum TaxID=1208366 RepID=A0A8H4ST72_9HYPO|nr:hypothetical protein FSARC_14471 [Fusarium sarcochroum]
MCEPHAAGEWRDSPSKSCAHDHQNATASTTRMSAEKATITRPSHSQSSAISPISPPNSPPRPCCGFQPLQHQSMDVLASQLGSSSLDHYQHDSSLSSARLPTAALSPVSLPDDECVDFHSLLSQQDSGSMELDAEDDDNLALENGQDSPSSSSKASAPPSTITIDPAALLEAPRLVSRTIYRPSPNGGFEVDEGYCEDDDDFSWLQPPVSLRSAGTPDGIRKRYELGFRRSADAASRCRNTIHSVPRMRRRDKKKSRHAQSAGSSSKDRSDSKVLRTVTSTQ